ncbi:MAG: AEC family transporter [Rhodospirillaceae bacterium]|jgi:malate permease and related proteins|nr:AEC family transporter [Rhodospirillaceae bacterium]MBT4218919.1 AEC family transporter [Rhodospirillaceae bacterium]MBT5013521.1 AEC family transporter [Rhodospirillaceae bacterium]MBT5309893.1 AEC family transporter [Rhodospirillaceae bacterium]MBT7355366.1 AEC family transporter [Rhodospirillaceae bacterium]
MFGDLLAIIAPVFVCAGIGYIWVKQDRPFEMDLVTALMTNIGAPSLIFITLVEVEMTFDAFTTMAWASAAAIAGFTIISGVVLKATGSNIRAFIPSMMFTNCGNMGLPLSLLAFGDPGLALAIVYFTVSSVFQFTIGVGIASGEMSVSGLARIPMLYAIFAAVAVIASGVTPPDVILNTTRLLGGMTIPMMLIALGVSLGRLRVASFKRSLLMSLLRLVMGFAVGYGVAWGFGFEGLERGIIIMQSAMPVAVFNYLFAERYKHNPEEVAGMVVLSTLISFATLPALLWYVI